MNTSGSARTARKSKAALVKELVAERAIKFAGRCVYCGSFCIGPACRAHRDLLDIETALREARDW